jgi:cyanophycin synthetase
MGEPGDLLLVFADALTRSWKQIIKFKPRAGADGEMRWPQAASLGAAPQPGGAAVHPGAAPESGSAARPEVRGPRAQTRKAPPAAGLSAEESAGASGDDAALEARGFVRDERGLRFVGEAAD